LSWVLGLALRLGHAPIFTLLFISQAGMVVAAAYVWRTVRLYASPSAAAMAVMLTLISPAATVYGVQVNHNSFLAPFWAAALFYGLAYLEGGKWRDAALFAVVTGLGLLVKYEMAFIVVCLLGLALVVPRSRAAFRRPATYVAILIAGAVIAPHVVWLVQNNGPSVSHALGRHRMTDAGALAVSAGNALVGLFVLFAVPAVILFVANARGGAAERPAWRSERGTIGAVLAFGPFVVMLIGVVVTFQIAKPLWTTPMTSSSAVGLMLLFPPRGARERGVAKGAVLLSTVAMVGFLAYLFIADVVTASRGGAMASYAADTRKLGAAVEDFWQAHTSEPLECIVIAEHSLAASPVLWTRSRPHYVDFIQGFWSTPSRIERCRKSGGVVVLTHIPGEQAIFDGFPAARSAPRLSVVVPAAFGFSGATWPVELIFLAPNGG
jgi:4-amino-4-deoxy-L-arabinose transferase-like glycosyltransferase